jgi:anti-sigma regulatory factor (Ser/Thr protein kinase)
MWVRAGRGIVPDVGVDVDHSALLPLSDTPTVVRAARQFVREVAHAWGYDAHICENVTLVTSELVTNALLHARSALGLRVSDVGHTLRVEVEDGDSRSPIMAATDRDAMGGRGLAVVTSEATTWGVDRTPHGKVVWAEFDADDH